MTVAVFCSDPTVTADIAFGGDDDPVVITEVFTTNDYRVTRPAVRDGVVVDIGANIGTFTVLTAMLGARQVHAYEPSAASRERLAGNVAANHVGPQVVIHPEAVAAGAGPGFLGGAGPGSHLADQGDPILTVGLNDILDGLEDVAFLKLDVEGAEYQIIDGVDPHLLRRVAMIAGEFHPPGRLSRWGAMMAKLADYGRLETLGHPKVGGLFWVRRY